ncbi:MAG TPA: SpoIID/LytB domain-containing protein [Oscillospiraceae bacterium]|nr:SpoIID/LytB domain-containing protein [Oscillospiraceae bacterium]HRW56665.1 SpoIID/LytB domain-containing protein [Oscillospiraceae bacterium]
MLKSKWKHKLIVPLLVMLGLLLAAGAGFAVYFTSDSGREWFDSFLNGGRFSGAASFSTEESSSEEEPSSEAASSSAPESSSEAASSSAPESSSEAASSSVPESSSEAASSSAPESSSEAASSSAPEPASEKTSSSVSIQVPRKESSSAAEEEEEDSEAESELPDLEDESPYYESSLENTATVNGKKMSEFDAVCQIVMAEIGGGGPEEAIKAHAVATFTYIKRCGNNLTAYVKTPVTSDVKAAVRAVIGCVILDDQSDGYIYAVYSAESCGVTAAAEWVWGYENRNLLPVESEYDTSTYTLKIDADEFAEKVSDSFDIDLEGDPGDWIEILSYWEDSDYINKIQLGDTTITARKLRENCLGSTVLKSTAFTVSYKSSTDQLVFECEGYGHGVGLSQYGAIDYANNDGWSFKKILLHYYSNCYLSMEE